MIRIEIIVHDECADEEDIEYLLSDLRYKVKYADGMGSFSINVVERDAD